MHIGLQIPAFNWPDGTAQIGPRLAEIARTADEAGFYSLWVMDHFFQIQGLGPVTDPMLEAYSTLSFLAGHTQRVKLGSMVTGVIYRHPGVLVKTVTTLDVLSGGRAYLGIGAAWFEREALALGVPFPAMKERFERLEEALQVARLMWSGEVTSFQGKHYQLQETLTSPAPLSRPHPPILVGGMGEKKTLPLVARFADACNLVDYIGDEGLRTKLEVLKRSCEQVGRPYEDIEKTVLSGVHLAPEGDRTPRQVIDRCRELSNLGFRHLILNMPNTHELRPLEIFAKEIIPEVASF